VATNATIFIFIKSDGVVVIFSAGQHRVAGIPVRCFVFHTDYRSNYGVLEDRPAEGPRPIGEPVSGRIPNSGVDLAESAAHAQDVRRQKRTFLGWLRWHPSRREVYGVPALQEEKPNVGDLVGVGHHVHV